MALDRTWYNTLVNDSGSGTNGSIIAKEDIDALMDAIDVAVVPGGSTTQVQFNDGGTAFGGDAGLTYNKTTDALSVVGPIQGAVSGDLVLNANGANRDVIVKVNAVEQFRMNGLTGSLDLAFGRIKFPATQNPSADANTLDDYEEGTWTPVLKFGGGVTGITYTTQVGTYTKVGRAVHIVFYLQLSNKGSSTGAATVTGLPFTSAAFVSLTPRLIGVTYTGQIVAYVSSSTTIELWYVVEAGTDTALADTNFGNTAQVGIAFTYFI